MALVRPRSRAQWRSSAATRFLLQSGLALAGMVLVWLNYRIYVLTIEGDMWMYYFEPGTLGSVASIAAVVLPLLILPRSVQRPSHITTWVLYIVAYIPACTIPFLSFPRDSLTPWRTMLTMILGLTTLVALVRSPFQLPPIPTPRLSRNAFIGTILVLMFVAVLVLLQTRGFRIDLDFASQYDRRFIAREIAAGRGVLRYAATTTGWFLVPILGALAVRRKSLLLFGAALLGAVGVFSFDGTKSPLLLLFIAIAVQWGATEMKLLQPVAMLAAFVIVLGFALTEYTFFQNSLINDSLARRTVIVPGYLAGSYHEYFSKNPLMMLADVSGFRALSPNYRGATVAYLVGEEYFQTAGMNANCGIWPNAFAQLSYYGVVAASCLAAGVLKAFDRFFMQTRNRVWFVGATATGLAWVEIALPTSFLSAGVLFWTMLSLDDSDRSHGSAVAGNLK